MSYYIMSYYIMMLIVLKSSYHTEFGLAMLLACSLNPGGNWRPLTSWSESNNAHDDVMLCYISSDDVMLCYISSGDVMLCYNSSDDVMLCYISSDDVMLCYISSDDVCFVISPVMM